MKRKIDREIIIFAILIPLFVYISFYTVSRSEGRLPPYSVTNKSRLGYSVFYEALAMLKYPIERTLKSPVSHPAEGIHIIAQSEGFDINDTEIKSWIADGGKIVYLSPLGFGHIDYAVAPVIKGDYKLYSFGKGAVISGSVTDVCNSALLKDTAKAYQLLEIMDQHRSMDDQLYFNESAMFQTGVKDSLWDHTSLGIKYLIYQLVILLMAYFYYRGKRFGKPVPLYEEVERTENEYLYSTASLYRQAGCWDLILDNYYQALVQSMNCSQDNWLLYWEENSLPDYRKAKQVYQFMEGLQPKPNAKECFQIVLAIEQLRSILKKRRDGVWKNLKKTT